MAYRYCMNSIALTFEPADGVDLNTYRAAAGTRTLLTHRDGRIPSATIPAMDRDGHARPAAADPACLIAG